MVYPRRLSASVLESGNAVGRMGTRVRCRAGRLTDAGGMADAPGIALGGYSGRERQDKLPPRSYYDPIIPGWPSDPQ